MRKFRVWLDSGATIHSTYGIEITLADLGYGDDEWDALSDFERDCIMKDVAFERADWGYQEIS